MILNNKQLTTYLRKKVGQEKLNRIVMGFNIVNLTNIDNILIERIGENKFEITEFNKEVKNEK